ncbi:MAG: tRNA lysidine(34) synthetase TilS, partial [Chloroflexota bacterium]
MDVTRAVRTLLQNHAVAAPGDALVVGVSGGPDSLCLLHVLRAMAPDLGLALHVGHLDHTLREESADEAAFVAALCAAWGVPCTVERRDVAALAAQRRASLEEAARQERYAFLCALARRVEATAVAVAHHADDQAETVLMHLLRGSGLAGLRGMLPVAWLDELRLGASPVPADERLRLVRPLLEVPRADILAYCAAHGLQPRYDRSNLDTTFFRNRLRHELLPVLETYNPNIRNVLRRTAQVAAGEYDLLRGLLDQAWAEVVRDEGAEAITLDLACARALPVALQRAVLREAIHRLRASLRNVNWTHVDDAVAVLARGHVGARAVLPQGLMLTLGYEAATLAAVGHVAPRPHWPRVTAPLAVAVPGSLELPEGGWRVNAVLVPREALPAGWERNPNPYLAYLDADLLGERPILRPRYPGDRIVPLGLGHAQLVREL